MGFNLVLRLRGSGVAMRTSSPSVSESGGLRITVSFGPEAKVFLCVTKSRP